MNKKETFIKEIEDLINTNKVVLSEDAAIFFAALKETKDKEKPEFTENGKRILLFIKEHYPEHARAAYNFYLLRNHLYLYTKHYK